MSSELSDIFLDPSFANTLTQYGGDTVPLEALVWQRFVGINNIDVSEPLTAAQEAAFQSMLKLYQGMGLSIHALTSTAVQPSSSNYESCYALAATLFPGINNVEMKDVWNGFLEHYSFTPSQIESQDLSALFTDYLYTLSDNVDAYNALPPSQQSPQTPPDQVYSIALWNRFLEVYGYSPTDTTTQAEEKQFVQFVQQYTNCWHITLGALQSSNPLPSGPGSEFFLSYIKGFYGQLSTAEQTDLWNQFLASQGLSSNPSDLSALQQPFATFITSLHAQEAAYAQATGISPNAEAERQVYSSAMDSLRKMLIASEGVVITNAAALKFYGAWQQQYTQEMTRAPNLVGVPDTDLNTSSYTTLTLPSGTDPSQWDLSKYTFGYDNISLKDVISWAYSTLSADPSTPVTFGDPKNPTGAYTFTMTQDSNGNPTITETFSIYLKNPQYANDVEYPRSIFTPPDPNYYTLVTQSAVLPATDAIGNPLRETTDASGNPLPTGTVGPLYTTSDWVTALEGKFDTIFADLANPTTPPYPSDPTYTVITNLEGDPTNATYPYKPLAITGRFLGGVTTSTDSKGNVSTDTSDLQNRTQQNALIQAYVNTVQARRSYVQNATQKLQSVLQTARASINNISSLWTSILSAISTLTQTLYGTYR
jgi:hypothetical protein